MLTPASSSNCFLIQSLCHTSLSIVTHDELARFKNMLRGADNNFVRQWYTGSEDRERLQQRCSDCVLALQAAIEKEKRKVSRLQRAGLYVTCYIFICAYTTCSPTYLYAHTPHAPGSRVHDADAAPRLSVFLLDRSCRHSSLWRCWRRRAGKQGEAAAAAAARLCSDQTTPHGSW